jgi:hypothetical protein
VRGLNEDPHEALRSLPGQLSSPVGGIHSGQGSHIGGPSPSSNGEAVAGAVPESRPGQDGHGIRHPLPPHFAMMGMGVPGGWAPISISDPEIVKCSDFAMEKGSFAKADGVKKYVVKSAQKQVVAGLNIEMVMDVHVGDKCFVKRFRVYDRFGALSLTAEEDVEGASCDGINK